MKKLGLFYALSFIPYTAILSVLIIASALTMTAEMLLLVFGILAAAAIVYQLLYIFKLGRREGVSAVKSIALFFMYLLIGFSVSLLLYYIDSFSNGISTYIFGGNVVYGSEAVNYLNRRFTYIPFIVTAVYAAVYFIASHKKALKE